MDYGNTIQTIPVVKVKQSLGRIDSQAGGYVFIVGQGGTETDQTDILLGQLHVADGPRHQRLQHGPAVVVQQVDFILGDVHSVIPKASTLIFLFFLLCSAAKLTMIMRRTSWVYVRSPPFRVMMSHFSGVQTMI